VYSGRMPIRNVIKPYIADSFYHLYNRGWNKGKIFLDDSDYEYFEYLLARTLSDAPIKDSKGREFVWLRPRIDLNSYCLMPNHFHLLVYQRDEMAITDLMRTIIIGYGMYFNKKYGRRGGLFESRFKAVPMRADDQLQHITRYIHLNHHDFRVWPYSSYGDYLESARSWLDVRTVLDLFESPKIYEQFVLDYEDEQRTRDEIKRQIGLDY
jgi:putative transposase